ncbi:hypothetical protein L2E82_22103 [Cichorium intybus]|uniref:Uncharacterized protein n=1 Tax=Cichorium intybus TaxID=13427 RepID=A0ACB9DXW7_CICIN|nr:hypothetical protein L2E82_22103 [Cichorium intybus]
MESDVSIETSSMIRITVIPIRTIYPHQFRDYVATLDRHHNMELFGISSFHTVPKKTSFPQQPWDLGNLRYKYVIGGSPPRSTEFSFSSLLPICGSTPHPKNHCPSSLDLDIVVV